MDYRTAMKILDLEDHRREQAGEPPVSDEARAAHLTALLIRPDPDRLGRLRAIAAACDYDEAFAGLSPLDTMRICEWRLLGDHEWRAAGSLARARANLTMARPASPEPAAAPGPAPSTP